MANSPPLAIMQGQFGSLIDAGWGIPSSITRLSGSVDQAGHVNGIYRTLASGERIWIQAVAGRSSIDTKNLDAETTHIAFSKLSGTQLMPKDRILRSGDTYAFDVINSETWETHRFSQLKQDLRVRLQSIITQSGKNFALEDGTSIYLVETS